MTKRERRKLIAAFLTNNPEWHTAEAIAASVGTTKENITHIADCMCAGSNPKVEKTSDRPARYRFNPSWREKLVANLDPTNLNPSARPIGTGGIRTNLTLTQEAREKAALIGEGNMSAGVEKAIAAYLL